MPFASSASFLAVAVPAVPEMIAPACPIVLPAGAVKPEEAALAAAPEPQEKRA